MAGTFVISLHVSDPAGNMANDSMTMTVLDTAMPVARAFASALSVTMVMEMIFDDGNSTDNVGVANWTWWVDGNELHGEKVRFVPTMVGTFNVTLTVHDARGNSATASLVLVVTEGEGGKRGGGDGSMAPGWAVAAAVLLAVILACALQLIRSRGKERPRKRDGNGKH